MEGLFGNGLPGRNPPQRGPYNFPSAPQDDPPPRSTAAPAPVPAPPGNTSMGANHPLNSQTAGYPQAANVLPSYPVATPDLRYLYLPSTLPPYPSQYLPTGSNGHNQFNYPGYAGQQASTGIPYQPMQYMNAPTTQGAGHGFPNGSTGGVSVLPPRERTSSSSTADESMEDDDPEEEGSEEKDMGKDASDKGGGGKDTGNPKKSKNRASDGPYCELCSLYGHIPFDCQLARWDELIPEPAAGNPVKDTVLLSEDQEKYQRLAGKLAQIVWNLIPDSEQPPESHQTMMKHLLRVLSDQPDNPEIVHNHLYGEEFQDKWLCLKAMCDPEYQGVVSLVDGRCRYCRNPRRSEAVTLCYQIMPRKDRMSVYREVGIVRA